MADDGSTIEDVKNAIATAASLVRGAVLDGIDKAAALAQAADSITRAQAMLDALPDPAAMLALAQHHEERRHGARRRAKLDAAQGIMAKLTRAQHATWPEGNTHRDGYVRGLEDAHNHVQALGDADVDSV
jgi:hypothetical protein